MNKELIESLNVLEKEKEISKLEFIEGKIGDSWFFAGTCDLQF